jgi:hypothetical protein
MSSRLDLLLTICSYRSKFMTTLCICRDRAPVRPPVMDVAFKPFPGNSRSVEVERLWIYPAAQSKGQYLFL